LRKVQTPIYDVPRQFRQDYEAHCRKLIDGEVLVLLKEGEAGPRLPIVCVVGKDKVRYCVDFKGVNIYIKPQQKNSSTPLNVIRQGQGKEFTSEFDITSAYHTMPLVFKQGMCTRTLWLVTSVIVLRHALLRQRCSVSVYPVHDQVV
jgi:hypothetical protein